MDNTLWLEEWMEKAKQDPYYQECLAEAGAQESYKKHPRHYQG